MDIYELHVRCALVPWSIAMMVDTVSMLCWKLSRRLYLPLSVHRGRGALGIAQ